MNDYSALIATIRKEYEILHEENQQIKIKIQKLEDYNTHQQLVDYNKKVMKKLPKRKTKYHQAVYQSSSSSESDDGNLIKKLLLQATKRKNKKQKKNKIYYEDVDGYENEYEESLSDEDNDDNDLEEEEIKEKLIPKNPKYLKYKKI